MPAGNHQASADYSLSDAGASSNRQCLALPDPITATPMDPGSTTRPPLNYDGEAMTGAKASIEVGFRHSSVQTIF
jgi:hypothetical protein